MFDFQEFPAPVGDKIKQLVGSKYFIAEAPFTCIAEDSSFAPLDTSYRPSDSAEIVFVCGWHRMVRSGDTDPIKQPSKNYRIEHAGLAGIPPIEAETDPAIGTEECEKRKVEWPEGVKPSHLKALAFPFNMLPDGKRVLFMPDKTSVALIPDHLWESIRDKAKKSRGSLLAHAYKVSLGVLQLWQELCPIVERRRKKLERLTSEGKNVSRYWHEVDPMGRDERIAQWILYWAPNLFENLRTKFKPFLEARKVLSKATGFTEGTVADIVGHA
jgi:hypothetical protein